MDFITTTNMIRMVSSTTTLMRWLVLLDTQRKRSSLYFIDRCMRMIGLSLPTI